MDDKTKIASLAGMVKQLRADNRALTEALQTTTKTAEEAAAALETADKAQIAADAGKAVEQGAAAAMSNTAADTITTEAADAVVEAVTKLDPAVGSELADAIIQAEGEKDGLTGEKMANLTAIHITKVAGKNRGGNVGTVKPKPGIDKKASGQGVLMSGSDLHSSKLAALDAKLTSRR